MVAKEGGVCISIARTSNGAGLHRHADALYRMGQKAILLQRNHREYTLYCGGMKMMCIDLHIVHVVCYDLLTFIYYTMCRSAVL